VLVDLVEAKLAKEWCIDCVKKAILECSHDDSSRFDAGDFVTGDNLSCYDLLQAFGIIVNLLHRQQKYIDGGINILETNFACPVSSILQVSRCANFNFHDEPRP